MPCMCGDICCPSCGPAQGNSKCLICGQWVSEDELHYDERGELRPGFQAAYDKAVQRERESEEAEAKFLEQLEKDAEANPWLGGSWRD